MSKDITLVAVWKKKAQYTVSFNTNGGNAISSVKVYEGNKVTKPTDPTRDGYTFVKWQLNGKDYDFSSKVTSDIKLVAVWEEITKYTVTFDTNGGSTIDSVKVYENEVVSKPSNPTKDKHNFVKWQLNGNDYDFSSKVTGDITLIAVWEKTEYTVSFDTDGGSNIANQTVTKGETVTEPTNPTKEGFDFVKWQLDDKDYDFSSKVTDDITLKAIWEEVVITCKIEEIEDSQVGQVRVFVFRNEEIVDGIVDITTINGKVKTVEISKDGYITNGAIIESIDNVKVK